MGMEHPHFHPADTVIHRRPHLQMQSQGSMARGDLIGLKSPFTAYVESCLLLYTVQYTVQMTACLLNFTRGWIHWIDS